MADVREDILLKMLGYGSSYTPIGKLRSDLGITNDGQSQEYINFRQTVKDLIEDELFAYDAESKKVHEAYNPEYKESVIDTQFNGWKIRLTSEGIKEAMKLKEEKATTQITEISEEFAAIIGSGTDLTKRIEALLDKTAVVYVGYENAFNGIYGALQIELWTAMNLLRDYNELAVRFSRLFGTSLNLVDIDKLIKVGNEKDGAINRAQLIKPNLERAIRNCKKAKALLNLRTKPIPAADVERLGHLREQLERISATTNSDMYNLYTKNIELAINEAEAGHDLATSMISGRVFSSLLNQIWERLPTKPPKEEVEKHGRIAFIIDYMKANKIIENGREDIERDIIASDKVSRDYTTHKVSVFIQHAEALRNLGSVVSLLGMVKSELDK